MIKSSMALTLGVFVASVALEARTSTMQFNKDTDGVELWTAIAQNTSNGTTEMSTMSTTWTDQVSLKNSGTYNVNLILTTNYSDGYPSPEAQAATNMNFIIEGSSNVSLTIKSGGVLGLRTKTAAEDFQATTSASYGAVFLRGNANLTIEGTGKLYSNDFKMSENASIDRTLVLKDEALFWTRGTTQIGATTATGVQTFRIEGSNISEAHVRNLQFVGATDTSANSVKGAKFEFISDANGISTIVNESAIQTLSGVIEVDFTNLLWDESWGDNHTFTLLTSNNNSSETALAGWVANQSTLATVTGAGDDWLFTNDKTSLYLTVSKVPEPSTYAMIFGALALAFVAYKRK